MIIRNVLKLLSIVCLTLALSLGVISTPSQALTVFPVDYTFTGFGKPGSKVSIGLTADLISPDPIFYDGVVKADGTYSILGKFAGKKGTLQILVETDTAIEATIMEYNFQNLETTTGFKIGPAPYKGTGATPGGNVSVTLPDGSKVIVPVDPAGTFEVLVANAQVGGPVIAKNLDAGLTLEVGTPIEGRYDGGVVEVAVTQVASKVVTPPTYTIVPAPASSSAPNPGSPSTPNPNVMQNTTPAGVKPAAAKATVRTGGITDYATTATIITGILAILFVFRKKFTQLR